METEIVFKNAGEPWTPEEDLQLNKLYNEEMLNIMDISEIHNRAPGGIISRLIKHNYIENRILARGYIAYKNSNLYNYIQKNKYFIIKIIVLNLIMLLFGLAGELKYLDYDSAIILGFIPFIYYFKLIHDKYITGKTSSENVNTYWFYFIIWSLYGIVAFLSYEYKNYAYNIIELFSKNFFGIFLSYIIFSGNY